MWSGKSVCYTENKTKQDYTGPSCTLDPHPFLFMLQGKSAVLFKHDTHHLTEVTMNGTVHCPKVYSSTIITGSFPEFWEKPHAGWTPLKYYKMDRKNMTLTFLLITIIYLFYSSSNNNPTQIEMKFTLSIRCIYKTHINTYWCKEIDKPRLSASRSYFAWVKVIRPQGDQFSSCTVPGKCRNIMSCGSTW